MVDFKTVFLEKFEPDIRSGAIKSICDLGSGESLNFIPLLDKYPELKYTGIEPSGRRAELAGKHLSRFKNARIFNSPGYEPLEGWGEFDLVVSLSVLEHVKRIEKFLSNSVAAARQGGLIVHRWDLGHALFPSSPKERFQVFLGDRLPALLPEDKFVSGLRPSRVKLLLEKSGARVEKETYHQMPGLKKLFKALPELTDELKRQAIEWEFALSSSGAELEEDMKLRLFPTAAVWARKA